MNTYPCTIVAGRCVFHRLDLSRGGCGFNHLRILGGDSRDGGRLFDRFRVEVDLYIERNSPAVEALEVWRPAFRKPPRRDIETRAIRSSIDQGTHQGRFERRLCLFDSGDENRERFDTLLALLEPRVE